jgi:hypothetical protein
MKRNEIIELNGVEYTLELNRESFLQIDKICNVQKSMEIIQKGLYEYQEEIDDSYNPFENNFDDEELEKQIKLKEETLYKIVERAFFIWLYPNHKLTISQVKEIVKPYLEDEEKIEFIGERLGYYLQECLKIRERHNQERKNLKAQINK